ncbi:hypothetical protein V6R21_25815 [Limibacter armeniacum]|uniref:hypothetical protein n=1 Tax=Limibacter armeniacum TaxID=466084 RepID=UPI002FE68711
MNKKTLRFLAFLLSMSMVFTFGCGDDSDDPDPVVVTYALANANPSTPTSNPDFTLTVSYDNDSYSSGTVVVSGHNSDVYPMPTGFGSGAVSKADKVFGDVEFETVSTSAGTVQLIWTKKADTSASARVAETDTQYSYTFSAQ